MIKQGDISSARTKVDEIKQAGGDASELSAEIERATAAQKSAAQYEASYQQVVQKYQQIPADDKNGLQGVLAAFQPLLKVEVPGPPRRINTSTRSIANSRPCERTKPLRLLRH